MKKGFEEILDICLDRITMRGESIEQCLVSYPEHAAELEPLLRSALSVSAASSAIKPSPECEKVAKYRLLAALEARENRKGHQRIPLWRWQRRWALALAMVVALLVIGSSIVTASASSLPGDTLYPVKTATEKVQGFFTWGSEAKASFDINIAQRRLNELQSLADGNRSIPQSLLDTMHTETQSAITILAQQKPVKTELVSRLLSLTSNQNTMLTRIIEKALPEAKPKLQEAQKHSEDTQVQASTLTFFLKVIGPKDKSIINAPSVQVSGSTIPGVVVKVSVNDSTETADVDQSGNFQVVVPLKAGINFIEIVASDVQGNKQSSTVTVTCVQGRMGGFGNHQTPTFSLPGMTK